MQVEDIASRFPSASQLNSRPLEGLKVALIDNTLGDGISDTVRNTTLDTAHHLEALGATVGRVAMPSFENGLPAYYIIATSEASSNLSRSSSIALYYELFA